MAKILIAEDSQFMRGILREVLEGEKHEVLEAENGTIAIEKYQSEKPDLLLLDIIMPEKDGLEVLKAIGNEAKVIVISAVGQETIVDQAKELGASDYVVKPFDNAKVVAAVNRVLEA